MCSLSLHHERLVHQDDGNKHLWKKDTGKGINWNISKFTISVFFLFEFLSTTFIIAL